MNKVKKPEIILIKFGSYEHLMQLQDEGLLYMNYLPYFWEIEDGELRGDPFDGVSRTERGHKVTIGSDKIIGGKWIMRMHPPEPKKINIFSMYALQPHIEESFPVDRMNFRFGEHALVLINNDEFLRRLELYLNSQEISFNADLVKYVNDDHTGEVGEFRKLKCFAYQFEWRLVCFDGPGEPWKIRIGSIKDISVIVRSDEVNKEIKIEFEPEV